MMTAICYKGFLLPYGKYGIISLNPYVFIDF